MRFEKVELNGFKSFRKKTEVLFPQGITAIVGPNGCGKSNIVDAIRWVLGEQSAHSLRGESMKDIIFNGSATRRPSGLAEVTLLFSETADNVNSGLENIQVTRRLFRTGESEYLINRVPCRLKDIVHLFADSGIGRNAYAIIEQGKVDFLLKAKPYERRALFEAAAGIMGYKVRRQEALGKLELTKQNLVRVFDIYEEVRKQRSVVQRQVKKLQRYRKAQQQLKDIRKSIFAFRFVQAKTEVEKNQSLLAAQEDREVGLRARSAEVEATLVTSRQQFYDLESQLTKQRTEQAKAASEIKQCAAEIANAHTRRTQMQEHNAQDEQQLMSLRSRLAELQTEKAKMQEALHEYATLTQEKEAACELLEEQLSDVEEVLKTHQTKLERTEATLIKTHERLAKAQNAVRELEIQAQHLEASSKRTYADETSIKNEFAALQQQLHDKTDELITISDRLNELQLMVHQSQLEQRELQNDKKELESHLREISETLLVNRSRIQSLTELIKSHEGFKEGVRELLRIYAQSNVKTDEPKLLADYIEAQPGYEKAVEAALGEHMQDVIVADEAMALTCAALIEEKKLDRCTLVWHNAANAMPTASPPEHDQLEDQPLLNFITADPRVQTWLAYLVRSFRFTAHQSTALATIEKDAAAAFVTAEGVIFGPHQSMTTGGARQKSSGHLHRKTQVKELQQTSATLEQQKQSKTSELEKIQARIQLLREQLETHEHSVHETQLLKVALERDRDHLSKEMIRLETRQKSMELEKKFVAEELKEIAHKKTTCEEEIARYSLDSAELEAARKKLKEEADACRKKREAVQALFHEERLMLTRYHEKREGLQRELQQLDGILRETTNREQLVKQNQDRRAVEAHQLSTRVAEAEQRISQLEGIIHVIEQEITHCEMVQQDLTELLTTNEQEEKNLRQDTAAVLSRLHETKLELNRWELEIQHVVESSGLNEAEIQSLSLEVDQSEAEEVANLNDKIAPLTTELESLGEVNFAAEEEFAEIDQRFQFLNDQQEDLQQAISELEEVIKRINATTDQLFDETFQRVRFHFQEVYQLLFPGGEADLNLVSADDEDGMGVEIMARPPGKKLQKLSLMSGGEKALTALALLFALVAHKPSPFLFLDEVDAPLDEANIDRFVNYLKLISSHTQVIVVTHHPVTMKVADLLYGITMIEPGISGLISVTLDDGKQLVSVP